MKQQQERADHSESLCKWAETKSATRYSVFECSNPKLRVPDGPTLADLGLCNCCTLFKPRLQS